MHLKPQASPSQRQAASAAAASVTVKKRAGAGPIVPITPRDTSSTAQEKARADSSASSGNEDARGEYQPPWLEEHLEEAEHRCDLGCPVPFRVSHWSSQRDEHRHAAANLAGGSTGSMWESNGPPEQWLILDLGKDVKVRGIQVRCPGTFCDPKEVTLLRGTLAGKDSSEAVAEPSQTTHAAFLSPREPDCPWIIVKRCVMQAGPQKRSQQCCHRIKFDDVVARFLRLVFSQTWGDGRRVRLLRPLLIYGVPVVGMDAAPLRHRNSLSTLFSEVVNLSPEDRELRRIARKYGIPLDDAEGVRDQFRRWDVDNKGFLNFSAFAKCVRAMVTSKATGLSVGADVCDSRIKLLWQDVDWDGSGRVELEEFVVWFHKTFCRKSHEKAVRSHHSDHEATVTERFYASLGTNRLRSAVVNRAKSQAL